MDEQGNTILYHGTGKNIDEFHPHTYFATDPKTAQKYATYTKGSSPQTYRVEAKLKRPATMADYREAKEELGNSAVNEDVFSHLESKGFDHFAPFGGKGEIVVFNPKKTVKPKFEDGGGITAYHGEEVMNRAYGGRNNERDNVWWHGSVSGDMRGGITGLHLGTKAAAEDALHASIGFPAEGEWDGTREYRNTKLAGKKNILKRNKFGITGHNVDAPDEDYYPHEHPNFPLKYSNGDPIPMDSKPSIKPFRIIGPMTNSIQNPHGDWKANGYMKAALKKRQAKNGYYYKNEGEDSGSISAVVPNGSHVIPYEEINKEDGGGITAYHGSPHEFEQFDTSKIGTGEGAQAYGHGLYFAEAEPVAEGYRDRVSSNKNKIDLVHKSTGQKIDEDTLGYDPTRQFFATYRDGVRQGDIAHVKEQWGNRLKSIDPEINEISKFLSDPSHDEDTKSYFNSRLEKLHKEKIDKTHALDLVDKVHAAPIGHMYEVHIDAHPDHFLDWDKPLSEQSPHIMKSLIEHRKENPTMWEKIKPHLDSDETAGTIYQHLAAGHPHGYAGASEWLQRAGIHGIRYLDQGSRGPTNNPTHNYVVFDHNRVNIKRRYAHGGEVEGYGDGGIIPHGDTKRNENLDNWHKDSHPLTKNEDGSPKIYYHGTSKDKDFKKFNVGRHGVWVTDDPKEASMYAEQNDSQGYKFDGRNVISTNTASRVIPVHVRITNPYTGPMPSHFAKTDNYKRAQSNFFDHLRASGFDGWIPEEQNGFVAVALSDPTQIKSATGNQGTFDPSNPDITKNEGGEVEGYGDGGEIPNPMSIFPKPQRMFPEDAPVAGGQYLSMPDKTDVTGHKAAVASIGVYPGGKPYFTASRDAVEETGTPGRGSATAKTNLFKQKAGWKWKDAPEGHEDTTTIVSVEHRGKHHYTLNAHFPKGVDLTRYENSPTEPRLRPTTRGNVELGPVAGTILVRGREHPVYHHVIVKNAGGEVDGYDKGGSTHEPHKRAEEQGYEIKGYHVTRGAYARQISSANRFDPERNVHGETATFFWDNPKAANDWAHYAAGIPSFDPNEMLDRHVDRVERHATAIMPVRIKKGKHLVVNWPDIAGSPHYDNRNMTKILNDARDQGYDTVRIKNMIETGPMSVEDFEKGIATGQYPPAQDQIAVLNPAMIRSEFAQFDPARQHENDIGAKKGGAIAKSPAKLHNPAIVEHALAKVSAPPPALGSLIEVAKRGRPF